MLQLLIQALIHQKHFSRTLDQEVRQFYLNKIISVDLGKVHLCKIPPITDKSLIGIYQI